MFYRAQRFIIIAALIMALAAVVSFAEGESPVKIYNTRLITNDVNSTYIEGEVAEATGQQIVVSNGLQTVASKYLPDTKARAEFRIKIPAKFISKKNMTVLYVRTDGMEGFGERVEVDYKERQAQKISVEKEKYSMTFPGTDESLKAEASSGEKLIYKSSNPDVATVDEDGNIIATGQGKADITVKQIGNGSYEEAEETVKVAVKSIDAYSITFHSSDEEEATTKQIVKTNEDSALQENTFKNGEHEFLGWATEDGGYVEYDDGDEIKDLAAKGENTDLYAVWTGDGAAAALAWAIHIANDNSFAYGASPATNNIGCYFCGTNQRNKPAGYEKTYVCLTFVGAAYAHGAEDPEILWADQHNKMPMYENNDNFTKFSCWTKLGSCGSLSISDLKPGDVIIEYAADNGSGHVCMYAGNDQLVEAHTPGWGAGTISVNNGAASRLSSLSGNSSNYVMRYTGPNS